MGIMPTQHPPFAMANNEDMYYKLLATQRSDLFWKAHSQRKPAGFFTDEFKDLITCMLQLHPHQRLCMADIIGHPWMQGEVSSRDEVVAEFQKRQEINKARATEEEDKKMAVKAKRANRRGEQIANNVYLSAEDLTEEESKDPHVIKLDMKPYNADLAKTTAFFTDYSPETILKLLTDSLNTNNTPYDISNKTWKLNYTKTREEDKKEESGLVMKEQAVIQIELFDAGNQRICVEFK